MNIQITLDDKIVRGRSPECLEKEIRQSLLIQDYLNGEISVGEFAEWMSLEYLEARQWLQQRGIWTDLRDPELLEISHQNAQKLKKSLPL